MSVNSAMARPEDKVGFDGRTKPIDVRQGDSDLNTAIEILPVSPREGVMELICHSFSAHLAEATGLAPQRLDFFARLVKQVPMRRLIYPSGFEHLPRVREAIVENLSRSERLRVKRERQSR